MTGNPVRMFFIVSDRIYRIRISSKLINHDSKSFNLFFFPAFDGNIKLEDLESSRIDVFTEQSQAEWARIYSIKFTDLKLKKQGIVEDFTTLLKVTFDYEKIEYVDYAPKDALIIHLPGFKGEIRPQLLPAHLHAVLFENT
jgi:hypothetical protein